MVGLAKAIKNVSVIGVCCSSKRRETFSIFVTDTDHYDFGQ